MVLMVYGKVHACGYISLTATWQVGLAEKGWIIGGFGWRGLVLGENLGVSGSGFWGLGHGVHGFMGFHGVHGGVRAWGSWFAPPV